MEFMSKILDIIGKFFERGAITDKKLSLFVAAAAGAIVLAFLISVIGIVIGGGKFNAVAGKAAKRLAADDTAKFKMAMEKLPKASKTSWEAYKKTRVGLPSAAFPASTCLTAGFDASLAKAAPMVVALVTFVASGFVALVCASGFGTAFISEMSLVAMLVCPLVGGLLTLLTYIFSRLKFASAVKTYSSFCALIDAKFNKPEAAAAANAAAYQEDSYEPSNAYQADNDESTSVNVEPPIYNQQEDDEPAPVVVDQVVITRPAEPVVVAAEPVVVAAEPVAPTRPSEPVRVEPITKPAEPTTRPVSKPVEEAKAEEDIVDRIDKMLAEGASATQIKEVARLLQIERAKPENRSPEQTRRLNDALAKLVKAMSTARK